MKLRAIDHVTLQVPDIRVARRYYEEVFGFSCRELSNEGSKSLQLEGGDVHFFITEMPAVDPEVVRRQHISFEVDSLTPVRDLLDKRGESYESGEYSGFRTRNYRWCEWRDPNGIRVECVEHVDAFD
jgi:catechol 2,3-dioxygenase-like lactoylglutathione lyase family enzyme